MSIYLYLIENILIVIKFVQIKWIFKSVALISLGNGTLYLLNMFIIKEPSLIKQPIDEPLPHGTGLGWGCSYCDADHRAWFPDWAAFSLSLHHSCHSLLKLKEVFKEIHRSWRATYWSRLWDWVGFDSYSFCMWKYDIHINLSIQPMWKMSI